MDTFQTNVIERLRLDKEKVADDGSNFVALIHVIDIAIVVGQP